MAGGHPTGHDVHWHNKKQSDCTCVKAKEQSKDSKESLKVQTSRAPGQVPHIPSGTFRAAWLCSILAMKERPPLDT